MVSSNLSEADLTDGLLGPLRPNTIAISCGKNKKGLYPADDIVKRVHEDGHVPVLCHYEQIDDEKMLCLLVFETDYIAEEVLRSLDLTSYRKDYYQSRRDAFAPSACIFSSGCASAINTASLLCNMNELMRSAQEQLFASKVNREPAAQSSIHSSHEHMVVPQTPMTNTCDTPASDPLSKNYAPNDATTARLVLDELIENADVSHASKLTVDMILNPTPTEIIHPRSPSIPPEPDDGVYIPIAKLDPNDHNLLYNVEAVHTVDDGPGGSVETFQLVVDIDEDGQHTHDDPDVAAEDIINNGAAQQENFQTTVIQLAIEDEEISTEVPVAGPLPIENPLPAQYQPLLTQYPPPVVPPIHLLGVIERFERAEKRSKEYAMHSTILHDMHVNDHLEHQRLCQTHIAMQFVLPASTSVDQAQKILFPSPPSQHALPAMTHLATVRLSPIPEGGEDDVDCSQIAHGSECSVNLKRKIVKLQGLKKVEVEDGYPAKRPRIQEWVSAVQAASSVQK